MPATTSTLPTVPSISISKQRAGRLGWRRSCVQPAVRMAPVQESLCLATICRSSTLVAVAVELEPAHLSFLMLDWLVQRKSEPPLPMYCTCSKKERKLHDDKRH